MSDLNSEPDAYVTCNIWVFNSLDTIAYCFEIEYGCSVFEALCLDALLI